MNQKDLLIERYEQLCHHNGDKPSSGESAFAEYVAGIVEMPDDYDGAQIRRQFALAISAAYSVGLRTGHESDKPTYKVVERPPVPMLLWCPDCGERHIDVGEFEAKPHHTHACQCCGLCWRPAVVDTVGVRYLPGFKNKGESR